jgi:hypothetical protein
LQAVPLFSRGYLFGSGAVTGNSAFNLFVGDHQVFLGVNPEFPVTAGSSGIFCEISPFEKVMACFEMKINPTQGFVPCKHF